MDGFVMKEYTECILSDKNLEKVLEKEYTVKDTSTIDNILFKANPESKPVETINYKPSTNESKIESLFKTNIPPGKHFKLEDAKDSTDSSLAFSSAGIEYPLEDILVQIKINNEKLKYLRAQVYMLEKFHDIALYKMANESISYNGVKEVQENYGHIYKTFKLSVTPVEKLLADLPCKIQEIKFLSELLRKHGDRSESL